MRAIIIPADAAQPIVAKEVADADAITALIGEHETIDAAPGLAHITGKGDIPEDLSTLTGQPEGLNDRATGILADAFDNPTYITGDVILTGKRSGNPISAPGSFYPYAPTV
jgi:hypothetical protein